LKRPHRRTCLTITGKTVAENMPCERPDGEVIYTRSAPITPDGGVAVLRAIFA